MMLLLPTTPLPSQAAADSRQFTPHTIKTASVSSFSLLKLFKASDIGHLRVWRKRMRQDRQICQCINKFFEMYVPGMKPTDEFTRKTTCHVFKKVIWYYTIGDPLWSVCRQFSQTAYVWKVLVKEDERLLYALGDSWQHVYYDAEIELSEHFHCHFEEYPAGLAIPVGRLDLDAIRGFMEHHTNSCNKRSDKDAEEQHWQDKEEEEVESEHEDDYDYDNQNADKDEDENGNRSDSHNDDDGKGEPEESLDQHQYDPNRIHCRTTLYPVGVPLVLFPSTKHPVSALTDAIKGHQALFECGLLHRDISPHNVLLIKGEGLGGFLHDLDYCAYVKEWDNFGTDDNDPPSSFGHVPIHGREILEQKPYKLKHDLESFYWLLVWLVLRHTDYRESWRGCAQIFNKPDLIDADDAKYGFLSDHANNDHYVRVHKNNPLSSLLREFVNRVLNVQNPLNHLNVLPLFEAALSRADWPKNDIAKPFGAEKSHYVTASVQSKQLSSRTIPSDSKLKRNRRNGGRALLD
ncbi:hypothetical protein AMATHDRAFT_7440 [Amanita thiersii Skay4041]|uniref:Fungal-type protein kinase domain-containing protein n=1 Tax=Amanita thiersii Skay4041 TaxID=703135 RepID=A0A2A9NG51_9AGAR|nr:hypothetical protein AMATHDRAFT_7440 [Amanita thiersii Skay4041]